MSNHLGRLTAQIVARPRLIIALVVAVVAIVVTSDFALTTRLLIAWDTCAITYLVLALLMFKGATPAHMRARAITLDDGSLAALVITIAAAIMSVATIILELHDIHMMATNGKVAHLAFGIVTLTCSWLFVHTSFAIHYAHEYYVAGDRARLEFPDTPEPDYWDFMYFAFVIGMTAQTSDVVVKSKAIRRYVLLHGVIAFFFNTALLALAINAAASTI